MKQTLIILLLVTPLLAACAVPGVGGATPTTPQPTVDINATISAMSETMVAGTLTAQPSATPQPPSATPTALPITDTPTPTATPAPTETPIPAETVTPQVFVGCFAPAGVNNISTGIFRMENNTKETLQVYLNGVSLSGNQTVNCSYTVTASFNTEIIFGNYEYTVQIGTKRTIEGKFVIVNTDKTTMRIYDKKVVVVGP